MDLISFKSFGIVSLVGMVYQNIPHALNLLSTEKADVVRTTGNAVKEFAQNQIEQGVQQGTSLTIEVLGKPIAHGVAQAVRDLTYEGVDFVKGQIHEISNTKDSPRSVIWPVPPVNTLGPVELLVEKFGDFVSWSGSKEGLAVYATVITAATVGYFVYQKVIAKRAIEEQVKNIQGVSKRTFLKQGSQNTPVQQ